MSNFASLHTALTGLRGAQVGLDTASHNIANANTPGFTRQRVVFTSRPAYHSPVGPVGTGVEVSDIARTRDLFLDARVRSASQEAARTGVRADLLSRLEGVLAEPENGISGELSELWSAFEDLALSPDDAAARRQVLSSLESLAGRINTIASGWERLERDTLQQHAVEVDTINGLLQKVADLNKAIPATLAREGTPNDLMDARDLALDELSAKLGVTVRTEQDGTVTVTLGDETLVSGTDAAQIAVGAGPSLTVGDPAVTLTPGGQLQGLQQFLTEDLPQQRADLDAFTATLVSQLNEQHALGLTPAGTAGGDLLSLGPDPDDPSRLRLSVVVSDGSQLAAADAAGGQFNGGNATALGRLRGGAADQHLRALVTELGREVATAVSAHASQEGIAASASYARMNQHGVSLDEEMVALVQFQRSLEAASRMMTAVDSALDTLINRTGLVGR